MGLTLTLDAQLDAMADGLNPQAIFGGSISLSAKGTRVSERPMDLIAGQWKNVDVGDLTPWMYIIFNDHASTQINVGWGQGAPGTLDANDPPIIWRGSAVPAIRANAAAGTCVVWIIEE